MRRVIDPIRRPAEGLAPARARRSHCATAPGARTWTLANRGRAVLADAGGGAETLEVYNGQGRLIFQYDTVAGTSRVFAGGANLDVVNPDGDIRFVAAGKIALCGAGGVTLAAQEAAGAPEQRAPAARLAVEPDHIDLAGPRLSVCADQGLVRILHATVVGRTLTAALENGALAAKRLEVTCERVASRTKSLVQQVEGAMQVTAGRLVTRVRETCRLRAARADLRSTEDFRIDGKDINLG